MRSKVRASWGVPYFISCVGEWSPPPAGSGDLRVEWVYFWESLLRQLLQEKFRNDRFLVHFVYPEYSQYEGQHLFSGDLFGFCIWHLLPIGVQYSPRKMSFQFSPSLFQDLCLETHPTFGSQPDFLYHTQRWLQVWNKHTSQSILSPISSACWIPQRSLESKTEMNHKEEEHQQEEDDWDWGYGGSTRNILQEAEFLFDNMPNMGEGSSSGDEEQQEGNGSSSENSGEEVEDDEEPEEDENLLQLPIQDSFIRLKELEINTNQTGVQEEEHSIQFSSNSV